MKTKYVDPINKARFKAYFAAAIKKGEPVTVGFPEPPEGETAYIYIFNGYIAVKLPAIFWSEYAQPAFLREAPKPGESFCISGHMEKTAEECLKFWNDITKTATNPATVTPYCKEQPKGIVRLFSVNRLPLYINCKYLDIFAWKTFTFTGSGSSSPVLAENTFCNVVFMPVRLDGSASDRAIIANL